MITKKKVTAALKKVIDPELGVNIVDLGLIYKVDVDPTAVGRDACARRTTVSSAKYKVKIVMTLTTPGCPLAGVFDPMIRKSLKAIGGLDTEKNVKIDLTFDPPWVVEMATEEIRAEFGF